MEIKTNESSGNGNGGGRRRKSPALLIVIVVIVFGCVAFSMVLQRNTLVDWWMPAAACLPLACVGGWFLAPSMRMLTAVESKAINVLAGIILAGSVIVTGAYSLNFYLSKPETAHGIEAKVVNKYSEVRKSKRSRRTVYTIVIKLPDSRHKNFEVPVADFNRYRNGDAITLHVEDGFFGIPVIKEMRLPAPHHKHRQRYGEQK